MKLKNVAKLVQGALLSCTLLSTTVVAMEGPQAGEEEVGIFFQYEGNVKKTTQAHVKELQKKCKKYSKIFFKKEEDFTKTFKAFIEAVDTFREGLYSLDLAYIEKYHTEVKLNTIYPWAEKRYYRKEFWGTGEADFIEQEFVLIKKSPTPEAIEEMLFVHEYDHEKDLAIETVSYSKSVEEINKMKWKPSTERIFDREYLFKASPYVVQFYNLDELTGGTEFYDKLKHLFTRIGDDFIMMSRAEKVSRKHDPNHVFQESDYYRMVFKKKAS